ncbi:MAG: hypothetical protein V4617_07720 [Gemmatimonadota bacterium]
MAAIGGLLTEPAFQAGTIRLELLQHLAVSACRGNHHASASDLRAWVNEILGALPVRSMEDPVEDVFISNVITPDGNFRLFEGIWELNDASVQSVIHALMRMSWARHASPVIPSVRALLAVSEALAERSGTPRWTVATHGEPVTEMLPPTLDVDELRARVHFSWEDFAALGVDSADLAPFILPASLHGRLRNDSLGHTALERYPLVPYAGGVITACPSAISPAIRRFVMEACETHGTLGDFATALRSVHRDAVFRELLPRVDAPHSVGVSALPTKPTRAPAPLPWDEVHCAIDVDKAGVVILLPDSLNGATRTGLTDPAFDEERTERLAHHLRDTTARLSATATAGGLVVIIHAGLGRGIALGIPHLPAHWHAVVISAGDFATFARSPESSLLQLWKLEEQRERLAKAGIQVPDSNGILNTFAFWLKRDFRLCPVDMPIPTESRGFVQIGTDFIHDFRVEERRIHDPHVATFDGAQRRMVPVHRMARAVFFPSMRGRLLYVSDEAARQGLLAGVCEHPELTVWVRASKESTVANVSYFMYQLWEAVLTWLDRLVPEVVDALRDPTAGASRPTAPPAMLQIHLAFAEAAAWATFPKPWEVAAARPAYRYTAAQYRIDVAIPPGLIALLGEPTNDGERALLEVVAVALLEAITSPSSAGVDHAPMDVERNATAAACVARAMRNADARHIHVFEATSPTDRIAALQPRRNADARFVFEEDRAVWTDGLAWQVFSRDAVAAEPTHDDEAASAHTDLARPRMITGRRACTQALGQLVAHIWARLREHLQQINGPSLIALVLDNLELIARDRDQWRRTARAVVALYGEEDDVTHISTAREFRRTTAGTSSRVLVEMAVCTCPATTGRPAALSDVDHLVAGVSELLMLAFDSDAIHSELAAPTLRFFASGLVAADRGFMQEVVVPFAAATHSSEFQAAAAAYADLYRPRFTRHPAGASPALVPVDAEGVTEDVRAASPTFDSDFVEACTAEYRIAPNRLLDALSELVSMGMEGDSLVVRTTRGAIATRLANVDGLSKNDIAAFFEMFALAPRPRWDRVPEPFAPRDWEPWRFRRRLSLTARPLVACGPAEDDAAPILFGLHHLGASVSYLFENVQSAWLPSLYFTSDAMIRYRGRVADVQGAAFTQQVAAALRTLGWTAMTEVQMSTLGAPAELGDLDVVAWRTGDDRILLIECKRLQPARTVGEIAEVLKQFRGDGHDRLGRHLRRVEWVHAHPNALFQHIGLTSEQPELTLLLITNRQVPMHFRAGLPISAEQILPFDTLADRLTARQPGA